MNEQRHILNTEGLRAYLIAEWYGADERDWAIIGPFENDEAMDAFWYSFFEKDEPGWDTLGWESTGDIHGSVGGASVKSPFEFLNKYPRTLDQLKDVHARAEFLEGLGLTVPEWVRVLGVQPLSRSALRIQAADAMDLWASRLAKDMMRPNIFLDGLKPPS